MKLIEYINFEIKISDEALLVKPIRLLYNKDRSKNKEQFIRQMSYLYFYADPRSSYNYITNDEERSKAIIAQEGLPKDFKPSEGLEKAISIYRQLTTTTSLLLLQDTRIAVDKVRDFLRNVDLNLLDDKGKPVYTINSITATIKQIPQLAKDLAEAEKLVTKEIEEQGRARGSQGNKTLMDDGVLL